MKKTEFKINNKGQLIGWANEVIDGFKIEWHDELIFKRYLKTNDFNEAINLMIYL